MNPIRATVGSLVFFCLAPATVAGWVPYALTGWRLPPFAPGRVGGAVVAAIGAVGLVECVGRFAIAGRGTPAPIAPTERLIVTGFYRYVRNPMYVAVVTIIAGQAWLFASLALLAYALTVWLAFAAFVLVYEEPTLHRQFGPDYDRYRAHVPRWWPRSSPWPGRAAE